MLAAILVALAPGAALAQHALEVPAESALEAETAIEPAPEATERGDRLHALARQTGELRAEAGQSYLRLMALRDRLFGSSDTGVIEVVQDNGVGLFYRLVEVTYAIDGEPVRHERDETGRLGQGRLEVHDGLLAPGEHRLSIVLRYVGDGGPLSYLRGYAFQVRSSHSFLVSPGQRTVLRLRTFNLGPEVPYEERLGLRMERSESPLRGRRR